MKIFISLLLVLTLLVLALFGLNKINPNILNDHRNYSNLIYSGILLIIFGTSFLSADIKNIFRSFKQFGIWIILFVVLIGGYGFRYQAKEFFAVVMLNLSPSSVTIKGKGTVAIAKSINGHYMLTAQINSQPIYFLVDTGATEVSLTSNDAKRIGIDTDKLVYNQPTSTANGINYAANITIPSIIIGNIVIENIDGSVVKDGMETSLLGMSFLSRLTTYSVQDEVLVLTKND